MKRFRLFIVGTIEVLFILANSSFAQDIETYTIPEKESCFSVTTPQPWKKEISEFPTVHPKTLKDTKLYNASFSPASKILIRFFEELDIENSLQFRIDHLKKTYMETFAEIKKSNIV